MKNYVLALLLSVCFLISLPAAVVNHEFAEVSDIQYYLQTPEITLSSFPEEITINPQGEVPDLFIVRETIIYDADLISIPLLEFTVDSSMINSVSVDTLLSIKYKYWFNICIRDKLLCDLPLAEILNIKKAA